MKKTLIAILFLLTIVNLITQGLTNKNLQKSIYPDSELIFGEDTLRNNPSVLIYPFNLELLAPSSGVQFYRDGIVFLSRSKRNEKMIERHLSFGNIESYYASLTDSVPGRPILFSPTCSFPFPSEGITFNNDFSTMYYSKISKKDARVKIYRAKSSPGRNNSEWTMDISPLAFCDNSNYTHPTLSSDGKIMIFSSDMPGSIGGMDLFITRYENGKWTAPQNSGNTLNSTGNELYPFLDSEKNLFFSSDGLSGYGGYDIFTCRFNGTGWEVPLNLSQVINTSMDDVAFTVNRNGKKSAFFTTREKSGTRGMQLLRISFNERYYPNDSTTLSTALYNIAIIELNITARKRFEEERLKAGKLKAERLKAERLKAERLKEERLEAEKQIPRDVVIYRVQFLSSTKSKGQYKISVGEKSYYTYEYFYKKEWRFAIGEFSNLEDAIELQRKCRQSGYNQAFVIAFKNNVRSLDTSLFKR